MNTIEKKVVNPLFFENSKGVERVIAEVDNMEEAFAEIYKFCSNLGYTIRYSRFWIEEHPMEEGIAWRISFDVGSWTEFFHVYFDTFEQAEKFRDTAN